MKLTPSKLNTYIMFNLPLAYIAGLRVKELDSKKCLVQVQHRWINQNPFKSMYWAVQAMAAELATGALLLKIINDNSHRMSTLVVKNSSEFYKKARGKIIFSCSQHEEIKNAVDHAIKSNDAVTIEIPATGVNEEKIETSSFVFTWSIKPK